MTTTTREARYAALQPAEARAEFRSGVVAPTSGWCHGFTQTNLIAVPQEAAYDFLLFAQRNPRPCPVLDVSDVGEPTTLLAPGADIRTDLAAYRVWKNGRLVAETADVVDHWRPDLVAFHIGCSFTFENVLHDNGIPLRHVEQGRNVPMYVTNRPCRPAGRFTGPLVVSMRPIPAAQVPSAVELSARMPSVHGAPVHIGDPESLVVGSLDAPDFGEPVEMRPGDVPVFWACGVTPQAAVMASRLPFAITHAPGHMLITDVPDHTYALGAPV
jgi:uncharacterized protein YcsI (UPF0317 family)